MLTQKQEMAAVSYTVAILIMYVLPLALITGRAASFFLGEVCGSALGLLVAVAGVIAVTSWCRGTFQ